VRRDDSFATVAQQRRNVGAWPAAGSLPRIVVGDELRADSRRTRLMTLVHRSHIVGENVVTTSGKPADARSRYGARHRQRLRPRIWTMSLVRYPPRKAKGVCASNVIPTVKFASLRDCRPQKPAPLHPPPAPSIRIGRGLRAAFGGRCVPRAASGWGIRWTMARTILWR